VKFKNFKKENDNNPEFHSYLNKKEAELRDKQSKLEQLRGIVEGNNYETSSSNSNNNFPIGLIVTGGILIAVGLVAALSIRQKSKSKNRSKK